MPFHVLFPILKHPAFLSPCVPRREHCGLMGLLPRLWHPAQCLARSRQAAKHFWMREPVTQVPLLGFRWHHVHAAAPALPGKARALLQTPGTSLESLSHVPILPGIGLSKTLKTMRTVKTRVPPHVLEHSWCSENCVEWTKE